MKIEVPQATIDKMIKSRITSFNKKIRDLENKLKRRDTTIHKLKKEVESLKGDLMGTSKGEAQKIAQLAQCLVSELERLNWVETHSDTRTCPECGVDFDDAAIV